ncbi:MAG TPA: type II toxin-antitoxin system VapC family toxin [Anaerolineales bacterium]|nr:type II toxin-antitoxin system VapC family toxin [Anaerolineales bacterium]
MNLYFDSSALVKRYVEEQGSSNVLDWMDNSDLNGTVLVTRAEVAAAITRAVRMHYVSHEEARQFLELFHEEWSSFHRLPVTERLVARADAVACEYNLRGYDAIHLAAALTWQELLEVAVTLVTYDRELAEAARASGLAVLP